MLGLFKGLAERMPGATVLLNAALAGIVPWVVYKINQTMHRYGDPPWKREKN